MSPARSLSACRRHSQPDDHARCLRHGGACRRRAMFPMLTGGKHRSPRASRGVTGWTIRRTVWLWT